MAVFMRRDEVAWFANLLQHFNLFLFLGFQRVTRQQIAPVQIENDFILFASWQSKEGNVFIFYQTPIVVIFHYFGSETLYFFGTGIGLKQKNLFGFLLVVSARC